MFPTRPKLDASQQGEFLVGAVFPTLLFSLQPDARFWYRMEILSVDRFRLSIHPCLPAEASGEPGFADRVALLCDYIGAIHREDIAACTGVQQGVRARRAKAGPLSHLEKPIAELRRWLESRLTETTATETIA